ncbi:MAG TPA: hypothetical protein VFD82_24535 [Planctomycetota bacterium]|nr:hypothetical protein [Planctomycetota bacterium]
MTSSLLVPAAILFLTVTATAQLRSGGMAPLPGIPVTAPPIDHPALGAQPWFNDAVAKSGSSPSDKVDEPDKEPGKRPGKNCRCADPAVAGPKLAGRDLKKAVDAVAALKWHESLKVARTHAGVSGKPVLWLQALGKDIDGFA